VIFREIPLAGAFLIEAQPASDSRGYFARSFCATEFAEHGLEASLAQCSVSFNERRGTLRGLHFQAPPYEEAKTIRCLRGALFDVIVDMRQGSPTMYEWFGTELTPGGVAMHAPRGFAHGFLTLQDETLVEYFISTPYVSEASRGVRYDDPRLAIRWPAVPQYISDRDLALPCLEEPRS